jgi:transmembrane sensor
MASESDREVAEQAAAAWIARRDTAEWDAPAFEAWLRESVSHRVAFYRLNAAWQEAGRLRVLRAAGDPETLVYGPAMSPDSDDSGVQSAPESSPARADRPRRSAFALAAGLAFLMLGAVAVWKIERSAPDRFTTVVGGLEAVPLADGSRVTLNTDSALQVALKARERVVNLERGEAYFEVAKEKARPFIVNVGNKRVIAVGTQFSVRRDGDSVQVIVTEGTVRMEELGAPGSTQSPVAWSSAGPSGVIPSAGGSAGGVLLPAGSIARAHADALLVQKEGSADIEKRLSWRTGQLIFRDTPLSEAVAEFNRYNERKFVIQDPSIGALQLGGIFRATNIDPFIELLKQGFPVRATEEGNRILLTHN